MISSNRYEELRDDFWSETNEDWTQEWRDELTPEEVALIQSWDKMADDGRLKMCKQIIELGKRAENNAGEF